MSAYFLVNITEVTDQAKMEQYRAGVLATVKRFGGQYRTIGGQAEALEGDWKPAFGVIIEFPTYQAAKQWHSSTEYADLLKLRLDCTRGNAVLIDGAVPEQFR